MHDNYSTAFRYMLQKASTVALAPIVAAALAILAAGLLAWPWPWIYVGINLVTVLVVYPLTIRIDHQTSGRGSDRSERQRDDIGSLLHLLAMYIALPLVAGLDERFTWPPDVNITWHAAGAAVLAAGLALTAWAAATNAYTWSEVMIQHDQRVCGAGPYRMVRHPAYAGVIIQALGIPFLLGSSWALIPGIAAALFMAFETSREDRMLQASLPGYGDYARKVRFRLVPGIW